MLALTLILMSMGEPPAKFLYPAFENRVRDLPNGYTLKMSVGMDSPGAIRCDDAKKYGIADGLYSCWFDGTAAKMRLIEQPAPNAATIPVFNPATRYYSPVWNQREEYCPPGKK